MSDNPDSFTHNEPAAQPGTTRISQARHKRDVFWQVSFPLGTAGLLLLGAALFIGKGPAASASLGADISLIFILVLTGIMVLPLILLIAVLAFGVWKLNDVLPQYTYILQGFFLLIQKRVSRAANIAVKPVMGLESRAAALRTIIPAVRGKSTARTHSSSK